MEAKEKMEAIKAYLTENKIEHWENVTFTDGKKNIVLALYIPKHNIAVNTGQNEQWYKTVRNYTHPVFIRESEDVKFVLEKVMNTISTPIGNIVPARAVWFRKNLKPEIVHCRTKKKKCRKNGQKTASPAS